MLLVREGYIPPCQGLYSQADSALSWLHRGEEEFATEVELELAARIDKVPGGGPDVCY